MVDLVLELMSEEIPARMQARAAENLKRFVTNGLVEVGLTYAAVASFATPRRLCLAVEGLLEQSPDTREERKGPRTDAPDQAIQGFLHSAGLAKDQLEVREDKKGQVYVAVIEKPGRAASDIIAELVPDVIRTFPWPKSMRWGDGALRWVRPLQSIVCVLSDESGVDIVPFEVGGIASGNQTAGHRFHAPDAFTVQNFEQYRADLKKAYVMLDAAERADHIWEDAKTLAFAQGLEVVEDNGLLAEVSGLVEWPVVLMGGIGAAFLDLPAEVLQTSMKEHQKFFSVRNPKTGRIEKFITVANRETTDQGATILAGNQKVLAARLADAKFFWENDLRVPLAEMALRLSNVTFHNKLGTQADRIERIAALVRELAPVVGADADIAERAARVAKADLSSEMVYEFPELQGIMGRYYAEAAGMDDAVAQACAEHYAPLGPSDTVPTAPVSVAVALADKIDTLTGFWAIDEKPTGSKDPFALRRAALGVIRLVLENEVCVGLLENFVSSYNHLLKGFSDKKELMYVEYESENDIYLSFTSHEELSEEGQDVLNTPFNLDEITKLSAERRLYRRIYKSIVVSKGNKASKIHDPSQDQEMPSSGTIANDLLSFMFDRLKVYLKDKGLSHDIIDACLDMPGHDDFTLLVKRAEALQSFLKTEDGVNLLQGFKRANNILTAEEKKDGVSYELDPDIKFAEDGAETDLFKALDAAEHRITPAMQAEDFAAAMTAMAGLRAPIDAFFDAVQVNSETQMIRRNRLCLLNRIRVVMGQVADFTQIEG